MRTTLLNFRDDAERTPLTEDHAILILTRRPSEAICIGDNITITVVDIGYGRVRLGIEAPKDVSVDRKEVREAKKNAQAEDDASDLRW